MLRALAGPVLFFFSLLAQANTSFLVLTDMHYNHAAMNSDYGQDTGKILWQASLNKTEKVIKEEKPSFIVVLGDLPSHSLLNSNRVRDLSETLRALRTLGTSKLPIYLVPGNNDSPLGDYHSYADNTGRSLLNLDKGWPAYQSEANCLTVGNHIPCVADSTGLKQFGYYTAYPLGKNYHLQLIVLNSVIFTARHYESDDGVSQEDAAKRELAWFAKALAAAKAHHDAVIVALHIPPGYDAYSKAPMWSTLTLDQQPLLNHFIALIDQYRGNIRVILSGHTHKEEVRKIYNDHGDFIALDISTPSISPVYANNPSMKMFYLNHNAAVHDTKTFFTSPLTPNWQQTPYRASQQFSCDITTVFDCLKNMSQKTLIDAVKPYYFSFGRGQAVDWDAVGESTVVECGSRRVD